jgi:V/A-type H+-transporting ATPase subunit I
MFRVVPMIKLSAVLLERDRHSVLKDLGRMGAIQLTSTQSGPETAPLPSGDYSKELARCNLMRARIEELRRSFGASLPSGEEEPEELTLDRAEENLCLVEEQAAPLLEYRRQLVERHKELTSLCQRVSSYRGIDIPLDDPGRFSFLHFATGNLPADKFESLEKQVGGSVALFPGQQQKGRQSLVAITTREGRLALEGALQEAGFQHEILPRVHEATLDGVCELRERERGEAAAELEELDGRLRAMAADFNRSLQEVERTVDVECRLLEETRKFPRTDDALLLSGWVPADDAAALALRIKETTGGKFVVKTTHPGNSTGDEIPVLLRHSRLLRPFEMLISTYGLPNYRELEPTFFVAISYIFMFGMMFGDAGHGAVLAACGLCALLAGRSEKVRDAGLLLLFGGSSSMVFGVVYGSYFGIEHFRKYALWHDPLEGDPMHLMYGAIGFGIVMISLGLILNTINRFRQGDFIGGILDKFGLAGLMFYWGTLVLLTQGAAIRSRGLITLWFVLFLIAPALAWAVKEPLEHIRRNHHGAGKEADGGMAGAVTEGLVGTFEAALSYLANTISFVRLAAYAMSHAALLAAAFVLADQVRGFSLGGGAWSILVIILGNLIAIVLEGIIASVQALRLEYYEFFGKFFSGSGRPFEPFRLTGGGRTPVS